MFNGHWVICLPVVYRDFRFCAVIPKRIDWADKLPSAHTVDKSTTGGPPLFVLRTGLQIRRDKLNGEFDLNEADFVGT